MKKYRRILWFHFSVYLRKNKEQRLEEPNHHVCSRILYNSHELTEGREHGADSEILRRTKQWQCDVSCNTEGAWEHGMKETSLLQKDKPRVHLPDGPREPNSDRESRVVAVRGCGSGREAWMSDEWVSALGANFWTQIPVTAAEQYWWECDTKMAKIAPPVLCIFYGNLKLVLISHIWHYWACFWGGHLAMWYCVSSEEQNKYNVLNYKKYHCFQMHGKVRCSDTCIKHQNQRANAQRRERGMESISDSVVSAAGVTTIRRKDDGNVEHTGRGILLSCKEQWDL